MSNLATCKNGHKYNPGSNETCPHCPKSQAGGISEFVSKPTELSGTKVESPGTDNSKTKIAEPNSNKTVISHVHQDDVKKTVFSNASSENAAKTMIVSNSTRIIDNSNQITINERKLAGLLVSYDRNPQGEVFKLFEGKNLIGSDPDCDILIPDDPGVSEKHLTILFRSGMYRFKDEFSTNGTFVNGEMMEEGKLSDKDILKIGKSRFWFLAVPGEMNV